MSTDAVRETLKNEVDLLENMIANAKAFPSTGFTKQGEFIKGSWARFLDDRRQTNMALIEASDRDLVADLKEELAQVQMYIADTRKSPDYTETWEKFLVCERDILNYLIGMADEK